MRDSSAHLEGRPRAARQDWSQAWQLPVFLMGLGLLVIGTYFALPERQEDDYPAAMDEVAEYLEVNEYDLARERLEFLQQHILQADRSAQAQFWKLWGDLHYEQLRAQQTGPGPGGAAVEANEQIADCYKQAEDLGRTLEGDSLRRWAEALVTLGREDEALDLVGRLEDEPASQRLAVLRQLIERHREAGPAAGLERLTALLSRFEDELRQESDPQARRRQRIWLAGVWAEMKLDAGDPEGARDELLIRRLPRLGGAGEPDVTPLLVLLARAYQQLGDLGEAGHYYELAQQKGPSPEQQAEILVGLGEIALAGSDASALEEAMGYFSRAVRDFPSEPAYVDALIGLGDCESRMESHEQALEHFRLAVEQLVDHSPHWDPRRQRVTDAVHAHQRRAAEMERYDLALDYLSLVRPLHRPELPEKLLLDFARIHEKIAEQRRAEGAREDLAPPAGRLANQQAATHYTQAANYYLRHARTVTMEDDVHGRSLWQAALCYDHAERWDKAIGVYAEFIDTRQKDPLWLRAVRRLGEAYLADGQYQVAATQFNKVMDDHPNTPEAYRSLVPLARAYLGLEEVGKAERVLTNVVTDHPSITPDSSIYRKALIELGALHYRLAEQDPARWAPAIERLSEAVDRYGDSPEGPVLRYRLADAYRQSAAHLEGELAQAQSLQDRRDIQNERDDRLDQAQAGYTRVVEELKARDQEQLSSLEKLFLRNAYFYRADCAYDLENYDEAITLYEEAAQQWRDDPASLVAQIQKVNAYCELGEFQPAKVANRQALERLKEIPDSAFDDQTLPMSRQHWEDWLRWTSSELFDGPGEAG
ncbi:MAG: tetratricopeptide repeat protein [Phycisphaeraceae bacterium]